MIHTKENNYPVDIITPLMVFLCYDVKHQLLSRCKHTSSKDTFSIFQVYSLPVFTRTLSISMAFFDLIITSCLTPNPSFLRKRKGIYYKRAKVFSE